MRKVGLKKVVDNLIGIFVENGCISFSIADKDMVNVLKCTNGVVL
jgi:hypothetical protein